MNRIRHYLFGGAVILAVLGSSAVPAQTSFQSYRCGDGTQFIVGFFEYDRRAHIQIDGKALTLGRRLALSGSRYSGRGITLEITKRATKIKRAGRRTAVCELQ